MFTLHNGDCLPFLKSLESQSVSAVISDPPYGIKIGGNGKITAVKEYTHVKWDDVGLTVEQFQEIKRVSINQAIFGFEHLADILGRANSVIVWDKKTRNNWDDNFSDCEIVWSNVETPTKIFRHLWMGALRVEKGERVHPTQKPIAVMKYIIERITEPNDIVLDPFMGSGSTGVACMELGRRFIGCEISPEYYSIAEKRIKQAAQSPALFTPSNNRVQRTGGESGQQSLFTAEQNLPAKVTRQSTRR